MFFKKITTQLRKIRARKPISFLPLWMGALLIISMISACGIDKGRVSQSFNDTGCKLEFAEWNAQSRHALSLYEGEVLQVHITCTSGSLDLDIRAENGTEAYTGNRLETSFFTVKISETGEYVIKITGKDATGNVTIKKSHQPLK